MGENIGRGRVIVLLILTALVFQGAFIVGSGNIPKGGEYGGTLRVALKNMVELNPLLADDDESWKVIDIMYDSLARLKTGDNDVVLPEPWLAKSWTIVDNDTVLVELRDGVMWHDSTDASPHYVDAGDIVYTFQSSGGMKNSVRYGTFLENLSASDIGNNTVEFNLSIFEHKGLFFTKVLTIPIIPSGFSNFSAENGCGPFKFKSEIPTTHMVTDEVFMLNAKGDETRASMKYRYIEDGTYTIKATIDNETLNDAAMDIKINNVTRLANLSYSYFTNGTEKVYMNGTFWDPNPLNYTMDYLNGTLNITYPLFDFQNDTLRITLFPIWEEGLNYTVDLPSGSIKILMPPPPTTLTIPPTSNLIASYNYMNITLTLEAFEDYFNGRPYLNNIAYSFYPDNPSTKYFDEGVDKAIIDLILKNIDWIGFELTSVQVSADRCIDVETDWCTKLSDETWKTVGRYYVELEADDEIRSNPERTLRKIMVWAVEEDITGTGNWTVLKDFDSEHNADKYIDDLHDIDPLWELRKKQTWLVQEFFLALDDNPGFEVLYLGINTQRIPLNDTYFRLALANLMDRNTHKSLLGPGREIGYSMVIPKNAYWYNQSIPTFKLERDENNDAILGPINQMLDSAGYKNMGSDGYRNLPESIGGNEFNLTLLIPPITTDSVESSIGSNIGQLLDAVGINVTVHKAKGSWEEIQTNVSSDNFDLALGIWETEIDPSFLFDLFHSSKNGTGAEFTNINNYIPTELVVNETLNGPDVKINATTNSTQLSKTNLISALVYKNDTLLAQPGNYTIDFDKGELTVTDVLFDFQNDTLNITYEYRVYDHFLDGANGALGFEDRQQYVRDLLGLVAEEVPIIPLVYYKTLEAYDRTVYEGWFGMPGGIRNFWSYISIPYIILGKLTIDVSSVVTTLMSNNPTPVIVSVKDEEGSGILGVYVQLSDENLVDASNTGIIAEVEGWTDSDGKFTTTYLAPNVTQVTEIEITAIGVIEKYEAFEPLEDEEDYVLKDVASLTVYPLVKEFEVGMERGSKSIDSGDGTDITITVNDKDTLLPVQNASIKIEILPKGFDASVSPLEGTTDSSGVFIANFTARVTTETFFQVSARISKEGYEELEKSTSVKVLMPYDDGPDRDALPILEISLGVVIIVLLLLLLLISRWGKPKKPKVPKEEAYELELEPEEEVIEEEVVETEGEEVAEEKEE